MAVKTYKKGSATKLSVNFQSNEFDCKGKGCCSSTSIDSSLVIYLQNIRSHFGKAVNISSGYRCATHNKNVNGATGSRHAKGQAADIYIIGVTPKEIAQYAESIGILGIGLYETDQDGHFVHIDTRDTKSFWYGQAQAKRTTFMDKIETPKEPQVSEVVVDASKVNTSAIDEKVMWDYFKSKGLNDYGIAGLMGNLYCESGLRPTNLQNNYEKSLNMTDAEYTAAVDAGIYTNFVKDSAGYGLAQWTYWSLKQDLLNYVQEKKASIGDGTVQMEFLAHQLSTDYKAVWQTLQSASSVLEASNAVLLKFERPADQSTNVQTKRAQQGQIYYDKYAKIEEVKTENKITSTFKQGDEVKLRAGATYFNKKSIPNWVFKSKLYVRSAVNPITGEVSVSTLKSGAITGVVHINDLEPYKTQFEQYQVKITASILNVRSGPGTQYSVNAVVKKGQSFTIIDQQNNWGYLKSKAGWICLDYAKKL